VDVSICTDCPCGPGHPTLAQGVTDANGIFNVTIPQVVGGTGVATSLCDQVTSPNTVPAFEYFGFPLSEPVLAVTANSPSLTLFTGTPAAQAQLLASIGATQDPLRGLVLAGTLDCLGSGARGVEVTTDSSGVNPFYAPGEVTATMSNATVYFFNVPPGYITLTATPLAISKPSSHVIVNVAAGTETFVLMFPTP
jgi:hypothetical protein